MLYLKVERNNWENMCQVSIDIIVFEMKTFARLALIIGANKFANKFANEEQ